MKEKGALRFLGRFLLLSAPLYLVIWSRLDFFNFQVLVAGQVAWLLEILGFEVSVSQYLVKGAGFTLEIVEECTGWRDMLAFCALVFATEKKGKLRALFLAPLVYLFNILRLVVTFIFGLSFPWLVEFVHNFLFQGVMLFFVFSIWYFGFLKVDNRV